MNEAGGRGGRKAVTGSRRRPHGSESVAARKSDKREEAKAQADVDLPVLFAEYLFRILLASGKNGGIFSGSRDRMCVETAGH